MKKRIKSRKHHFLLLELMVAAFILLICIAPAMRIFTSIFQEQQEIIRENQRDHIAHLIHALVTEKLYKREIEFLENSEAEAIPLKDQELDEELNKYSYSAQASLTIIDSVKPKGEDYPNKYLAQLVIKLIDRSSGAESRAKAQKIINQDPSDTFYDYMIYIDAGAKSKNEPGKRGSSGKENSSEEENENDPQNSGIKNKKNEAGPPLPSSTAARKEAS